MVHWLNPTETTVRSPHVKGRDLECLVLNENIKKEHNQINQNLEWKELVEYKLQKAQPAVYRRQQQGMVPSGKKSQRIVLDLSSTSGDYINTSVQFVGNNM